MKFVSNLLQEKLVSLPPLREVVKRYKLDPKKKLGQNFLFDLNITERIAKCAGNLSDHTVIEIGPGPGGLTRALLMQGAEQLVVIEQDKDCIPALEAIQAIAQDRMRIIQGDALQVDITDLAQGRPVKIVANLPYNIGTELLFGWLDQLESITSMTLMFQKEVAERIVAEPGSKAYGRLSVMAQWLCECATHFTLPPEAFTPPPKVHSSVITLQRREQPLAVADASSLKALCRTAFGQRRKMLRGSLKSLVDDPVRILQMAGIAGESRPETLSIEELCQLSEVIRQQYS